MKVNWKDKQTIHEAVQKASCKSDVLKQFGITCTMGNYLTLDKWCATHAIDTSHLSGENVRNAKTRNRQQLKAIWTVNTAFVQNCACPRHIVKKLVLTHNLIPYECTCGLTDTWQGKPITLQLEHMNGINTDHRLENLCFLCPNCHSQTPTYAGRNK